MPVPARRSPRLDVLYRAACASSSALQEAHGRLERAAPEARGACLLAVQAARARYAEAARHYNEVLLRCPE